MNLCKAINKECKNAPICIHKENDFMVPEIFSMSCNFYQPTEADSAPQNEETAPAEDTPDEEESEPETESDALDAETAAEALEESIKEQMASLEIDDTLPDQDESTSKYPAKKKKGGKEGVSQEKKDEIAQMYEDKVPIKEIIKKTGLAKSTVYKILQEARGM